MRIQGRFSLLQCLAVTGVILIGSHALAPLPPVTQTDVYCAGVDLRDLSSGVARERYRASLDRIVDRVESNTLNDEVVVEFIKANKDLFERSHRAAAALAKVADTLDARGIWVDPADVTRGMWFATYQLERLPELVAEEPKLAAVSNRLTNLYAVAGEYANELSATTGQRLNLTNFENLRLNGKGRQGWEGEADGFRQAFIASQMAMQPGQLRRAAVLEALARSHLEQIRLHVVSEKIPSSRAE